VTIGHRQEAAIDILRKVGMITIRLKQAKGTFIGCELVRFWLRLLPDNGDLMLSVETPSLAESLRYAVVQ